jgi:hypothetical protein
VSRVSGARQGDQWRTDCALSDLSVWSTRRVNPLEFRDSCGELSVPLFGQCSRLTWSYRHPL